MDSTETSLLATIAAAPDDPQPKLVYADWLEEQGDSRAEYLRLEQEFAEQSIWTPKYWALKEWRNAFRKDIDDDWLEAVGYPTYYMPLFSKLPESREARWKLVDRFTDFWCKQPLNASSGNSNAEIDAAEKSLGQKLPTAQREWYRLAGKRTDIWSSQDTLSSLEHVSLERDTLWFRWENQGVEEWGVRIDNTSSDPPVVVANTHDGFDSPTTTSFAIQTLLFENIAALGAEGEFTEIDQSFARCDLSEKYWVAKPIRFYEACDLVIKVEVENAFITVAAQNQQALTQLSPELRESLDELFGGP